MGDEVGSLAYEAAADGGEDEFGDGVEAEFVHDAGAVGFDGVEGEFEAVGYVLIGVAFGEHLVDLAFAFGEGIVAVGLDLGVVGEEFLEAWGVVLFAAG